MLNNKVAAFACSTSSIGANTAAWEICQRDRVKEMCAVAVMEICYVFTHALASPIGTQLGDLFFSPENLSERIYKGNKAYP